MTPQGHDDRWLDALADKVRESGGPSNERLQAQRQALRSYAATASPRRPHIWRFALVGAAAVVLSAVATWVVQHRAPADLAISVGHHSAAPGAWLEATGSAVVVAVATAGGFDLQPGSAARVAQASQRSVRVELHHGRIVADVESAPGRTWTIHAGPYVVRVVGTQLSVDWQADVAALQVGVTKGVVEVSGGNLVSAMAVSAGQVLDLDGRKGTSRLAPATAVPSSQDAMQPAEKPTTAQLRSPAKHVDHATTVSWRDLFESGQFSEAYDSASKTGAFNTLDAATAEDLLQLANLARYHGDAKRAQRVLLALRGRFKGTPQATMAAFLLGRTAMDLSGDLASAAKWFETYIGEDANAPLVEEASGRLIDLYRRTGDLERARERARLYLARFPQGAYADTARLVAP